MGTNDGKDEFSGWRNGVLVSSYKKMEELMESNPRVMVSEPLPREEVNELLRWEAEGMIESAVRVMNRRGRGSWLQIHNGKMGDWEGCMRDECHLNRKGVTELVSKFKQATLLL